MRTQATYKHARMTPRKLRLVARLLPGLSVQQAQLQLTHANSKAADLVAKVLTSAAANAQENFDMDNQSLKVAEVQINEGIKMKRYQPASRGMAHPYVKRTSHVTVIVEGAGQDTQTKKKKAAIETISVDEYTADQARSEAAEEQAEKVAADTEQKPTKSMPKSQDKEIEEAYQKTKIQQQGGDKQKTHRRKSL